LNGSYAKISTYPYPGVIRLNDPGHFVKGAWVSGCFDDAEEIKDMHKKAINGLLEINSELAHDVLKFKYMSRWNRFKFFLTGRA